MRRESRDAHETARERWIVAQPIQHGHRLLTRTGKDSVDMPGPQLVVFEDA